MNADHTSVPGDTLCEALVGQARSHPSALTSFPGDATSLILSTLDTAAQRYARALVGLGVRPGDVVGLLATGAELLVAFFGVLHAGAAATILPTRSHTTGGVGHERWLGRIVAAAGITTLITTPALQEIADQLPPAHPGLRVLPSSLPDDESVTLPPVAPDDLAIVQFSSGSTGTPRGIMLPHRAAIAGVRAIVESSRMTPEEVLVQWVPQYHDMGLFGLLANLLNGGSSHVFTPFAFLRRPDAFLRYVAEHRGSVITGPNFGYETLIDAAGPELSKGIDLSSLRLAYNGSEPVSPVTIRRFEQILGPTGVRPSVMYPVYGMAEVTLAISFPEPGSRPHVIDVDRNTLRDGCPVVQVAAGEPSAKALVSVGQPVLGIQVRIADEHENPCRNGVFGEIQVRGAAVTSGYLHDEQATRAAFVDGWLKTGDLGFELDGHLYVAGRRKEMVIVHGRNFFPEDVESIVRDMVGVHRRRCVAVPNAEPESAEYLGVIVESALPAGGWPGLADEVRQRVAVELDLHAVRVHVVEPRWLTRTSSGKWQRLPALARLTERLSNRSPLSQG